MTLKHLRVLALAGTFVLGTAALGFAAGSGSSTGMGGSTAGSSNTSTHTSGSSPGTTGLERAEQSGSAQGIKEKEMHGKAFQREDKHDLDKDKR